MNWGKIVCAVLVVPAVYAGISLLRPSFANAGIEDSVPVSGTELSLGDDSFSVPLPGDFSRFKSRGLDCVVQEDSPNTFQLNCGKKSQRRADYDFDNSRFAMGSISKGDSSAMDELVGGDGRIRLNALLGYENFVFGIGAEHQSIMQNLQVGLSEGWNASILGVSYHINMDFRWYFGKNKNMFVGIGNDHISDRLIDGDVALEEFLLEHPEITIDTPVIDVVSYQFGGERNLGDRTQVEGRIGWNAYQTTPPYTFSAAWDKSKRGPPYPYNGFLEAKASHLLEEHWKLFGQLQTEFNRHKQPANWRGGIEVDFSPYPVGIRAYFGQNIGRARSALEKTRFGVEGNAESIRMLEVYLTN